MQRRSRPAARHLSTRFNLEYLAKGVCVQPREIDGKTVAYPDTLVGTDSHTTMINGLGVLGWGVGGIEAEAAMLGQPIYDAASARSSASSLVGRNCRAGATATDLDADASSQMLRAHGVVGKFVEFFGSGMSSRP